MYKVISSLLTVLSDSSSPIRTCSNYWPLFGTMVSRDSDEKACWANCWRSASSERCSRSTARCTWWHPPRRWDYSWKSRSWSSYVTPRRTPSSWVSLIAMYTYIIPCSIISILDYQIARRILPARFNRELHASIIKQALTKYLICSASRHGVTENRIPVDRVIWQRVDAGDIGRLEETRTRLHTGLRRDRRGHLCDQ